MPLPSDNDTYSTKKTRRDQAREKARVQRIAGLRRRRLNRRYLQGSLILGVVAIAALIVLMVVNTGAPASAIGPKNMASNGILFSGADMKAVSSAPAKANGVAVPTSKSSAKTPVSIVTYIDYQCPACKLFESANLAKIEEWVKAGIATIEVHPISILDPKSLGNRYSTRAANAAVCVANSDPDTFYAVTGALYANQPSELTNGKTDAQILATLKVAGAKSDELTACVKGETFARWVSASTAQLNVKGTIKTFQGVATEPQLFAGTPTVFVNGETYTGAPGDAESFENFVLQIAKG